MMNDEKLLELAEQAEHSPDAIDELCLRRENIGRLCKLALDSQRLRERLRFPVEKEEMLDEYYSLLPKHNPTKEEQARIEELRQKLNDMGMHSGEDRSVLLLEVIDEHIAICKEGREDRDKPVEISDETKQILVKLWEEVSLKKEPDDETRSLMLEAWRAIKQL